MPDFGMLDGDLRGLSDAATAALGPEPSGGRCRSH